MTKPLTIDLSAVTLLSSMSLGVLAIALRDALVAGGQLALVAAAGTIAQRVLEIAVLPYTSTD